MMNHQELVKEIAQELYKDEKSLVLILYGSVSRNEEKSNSDIDLLLISTEMHFEVRHELRYGITVEFHDMHLDFLHRFIEKKERSICSIISEGIILFTKIPQIEQIVAEAKKIHESTPSVNDMWKEERYVLRKRFELTEIYKDLLDIDDEIAFNYVVSLLITNALPMLNENYCLRQQSKKKTIPYLKSNCYDAYKFLEFLLSTNCSIIEKRKAAKNLIDFVLKAHSGILEGNFTLFTLKNLSDL